LPGGWIHEVSSPNKTIAVNGRALQLADLPVALRIHRQDERMGTKPEHMFPGFVELMWATATSIQKGEQQLPSNLYVLVFLFSLRKNTCFSFSVTSPANCSNRSWPTSCAKNPQIPKTDRKKNFLYCPSCEKSG